MKQVLTLSTEMWSEREENEGRNGACTEVWNDVPVT